MNIHTYGADARLNYCREYLLTKRIHSVGNVVLLPIPSAKGGKLVKLGSESEFEQMCSRLNAGDVVVGYELPREIRATLMSLGAICVDVSGDEEYLKENADLTAIGTLGRLLTEEVAAPADMKVGIIGYGRIGERLVHLLLFLGAKVTVFTSKSGLLENLCMLGVSGADSLSINSPDALDKLQGLDILINTAPARLISDAAAKRIASARVIELASGENFPKEISCERFSSVPSYMYPKSAGVVLGKAVLRMLGEKN